MTMLENAAARSALMQNAIAEGYVCTPGGFRPKSFVHQVRHGQSVVKRAGISHLMDMVTMQLVQGAADAEKEANPADQAGGWITWATWNNGTKKAISYFATKWEVPPAPTSQSGQLIYLFNGLQDPKGSEILQPVLQWGASGAGGGNYWSVASWHVDSNGHAFCTPATEVSAGDALTGIITMVAVFADETRNYTCEFQSLAGTRLMALGLAELVDAEETLEAYGVTSRLDYPAAQATPMTQINLQVMGNQAPLTWATNTMASPAYGEHTRVVSDGTPDGEVNLYY
jgi:hypothetical protein